MSFGVGHEQNAFIWWLKNLSVLKMFANLGIGMRKSPLYSSSNYTTFLCFFSLSDFFEVVWEGVGANNFSLTRNLPTFTYSLSLATLLIGSREYLQHKN